MPRRDDLKRILVIGSGPIVIGQAAEFDYSGAQASRRGSSGNSLRPSADTPEVRAGCLA